MKFVKIILFFYLSWSSASSAQTQVLGEAVMAISKPFRDGFKRDVLSAFDSHVKSENYDYQGIDVQFTHQRWKINYPSVCANYRSSSHKITKCSTAALSLFKLGCDQFRSKRNRAAREDAEMLMYCNAANKYHPITIVSSANKNDMFKKQNNKKSDECKQLIAQSAGSYDKGLIANRNKACGL
jgi:hypothetical protein